MKNCAFSSLKNCMLFQLQKLEYFFGQHSAKLYTIFVSVKNTYSRNGGKKLTFSLAAEGATGTYEKERS
jgi:hypothetical protein